MKYEIEYKLIKLPKELKNNPCANCALSIGRFLCLDRSLCKEEKNKIWVIKNFKKI